MIADEEETGCTSWDTDPDGSYVNVVVFPRASVDDSALPSPSYVDDVVDSVVPVESRSDVDVTSPLAS